MKKKIAVIGGGLGSLSTVYNLMSLPNSKELFDITIYQKGWLLGGKGSSGVNVEKGFRIEEHGIHFWFGFYENGFSLMKTVYKSLDRPKGSPVATFHDAFKAQPFMDFAQKIDGNWTDWRVPFLPIPGEVGDGKFENPIEEVIEIGLIYLADEFNKIIQEIAQGCLGFFKNPFRKRSAMPKHPVHEAILTDFEKKLANNISHPIERRLRAMAQFYSEVNNHANVHNKIHADYIHSFKLYIFDEIGYLLSGFPNIFRVWCLIDFGLAVFKGIFEDGVLSLKDDKLVLDFSLINDYDFTEWLIYHGADKEYIMQNPAVKSLYDGPFAFFRGAVSTPNVEAGTALNIFFRLVFTCKEHIMWRMQGGMGDIVFAPIYEYFKKEFPENVHFEFFHDAKNLTLTPDKKSVKTIEFDKQVEMIDKTKEYSPLITVKGFSCWPSVPLFNQINPAQAKKIEENPTNFDSDWTNWESQKVTKTLGIDYDEIIIGASLASLPIFCSELISENSKWANMLNKVGTVQTQAFQIWLTKDPKELGVEPGKVLSTYVEPTDTYADMYQTLAREDWSHFDNQPKYLFYVCGAMLDAETIPPKQAIYFPKNQQELVYDNMVKYVEDDLKFILPKAFDEDGNFDWNIVFDPTGGIGSERLKYQYFRSNIDTSERYVFSLKGSSKYRLKTSESGFNNVFLTGDWIQNGMNIGFVEGATISGILTARAVSGNDKIPLYLPW